MTSLVDSDWIDVSKFQHVGGPEHEVKKGLHVRVVFRTKRRIPQGQWQSRMLLDISNDQELDLDDAVQLGLDLGQGPFQTYEADSVHTLDLQTSFDSLDKFTRNQIMNVGLLRLSLIGPDDQKMAGLDVISQISARAAPDSQSSPPLVISLYSPLPLPGVPTMGENIACEPAADDDDAMQE